MRLEINELYLNSELQRANLLLTGMCVRNSETGLLVFIHIFPEEGQLVKKNWLNLNEFWFLVNRIVQG